MAIFYPDILEQKTAAREFTYRDKDVMLYALGVGMGQDPMNEDELAYVYERNLKVIPTAATVLASNMRSAGGPAPVMPEGHRQSQINFLMVVHGEQKVELHKPLPTTGTFTAEGHTVGAYDKGEGKGAVIINETVWKDDKGEKVATLTGSTFARGDGGFGGPSEGAPEPHVVPTRKADLSVDFTTREDQALLYRLNGDRNPLHSDPESARRSGFQRPILHGLCTYGITCRAVLQAITGFDPDQILSHQARFSAPVIPGDTITVDLWKDGRNISFEARVKERGATVIKNGLTVLRA
ncbi:MaoC/PaaZ C-terminal domain-containing protein [Phenylobacterium sp.]|uniref:MaoC/PaaZ C-terminal domain-containing protein n=1 Tax=Phenylobacterium sp. TaxID=1871053 RepID=UPI00286E2878|nr:MaoC/PaaZ C-terminal domain-containing protein [Phenylobacterium sp.]